MAGAAFATVLPGATVTIHPDPLAVGPESYSVRPPVQPSDTEPLQSTKSGEATGHRTRRTAATGTVTLINYSGDVVFVPQGTLVSARRQRALRHPAGGERAGRASSASPAAPMSRSRPSSPAPPAIFRRR